jgi:hypothetical protein
VQLVSRLYTYWAIRLWLSFVWFFFRERHKEQGVLGRTNRLHSFLYIFFETTRTAQKTSRPAVLILLRVYSLPLERVYGAVVLQRYGDAYTHTHTECKVIS